MCHLYPLCCYFKRLLSGALFYFGYVGCMKCTYAFISCISGALCLVLALDSLFFLSRDCTTFYIYVWFFLCISYHFDILHGARRNISTVLRAPRGLILREHMNVGCHARFWALTIRYRYVYEYAVVSWIFLDELDFPVILISSLCYFLDASFYCHWSLA